MMLIYCLVGFFVLIIVLGSKCDKELDDIQQEKFLKEWNQKHGKKKKS